MAQIDIPPGAGTERSRVYRHRPQMEPGIRAFNDSVYVHSQLALRELEAARYAIAIVNQCPI